MIHLPDKTVYFTRDTRLPPYLPLPLFLLRSGLSMTACALYALLLNRAQLSARNGWADERGRVYVIFPVEEMCRTLGRERTAVKRALGALEEAGLLERCLPPGERAYRLYLKYAGNTAAKGGENRPSEGAKTDPRGVRKRTPSNYTSNKNKKTISRDYFYQEEDSL